MLQLASDMLQRQIGACPEEIKVIYNNLLRFIQDYVLNV